MPVMMWISLRIGEKVFVQHPRTTYSRVADHEEGDRPVKTGKQQGHAWRYGVNLYTQQQALAGQGRVKYTTVTAITNGQIDEICIYS